MANGLDVLAQGVVSNNLILLQGLGIYALVRYSKDLQTGLKAGLGMFGTMLTATIMLWAIGSFVPSFYGLEMPFYLLIALLSSLMWQRILQRTTKSPDMDFSITSGLILNTALVGLLLTLGNNGVTGPSLVYHGFSSGLGFALVVVIMAAIRERLELAPIPKALQGVPIFLITAGLFALALMGFRL